MFFFGCGASVDNRYSKQEEIEKLIDKTTGIELKEEFDFSKYQTQIDLRLIPLPSITNNVPIDKNQLWIGYDKNQANTKMSFHKLRGYRVQVLATDNYQQADSMRTSVYFKTNHKNIYIDFESPLYKVKVGDYEDYIPAKELGFKLNQLGFNTALVIPDFITVIKAND